MSFQNLHEGQMQKTQLYHCVIYKLFFFFLFVYSRASKKKNISLIVSQVDGISPSIKFNPYYYYKI